MSKKNKIQITYREVFRDTLATSHAEIAMMCTAAKEIEVKERGEHNDGTQYYVLKVIFDPKDLKA